MVINTHLTEKWLDYYGLSINETMQLGFNEFHQLKNSLSKHLAFIKQQTENAADILPKKLKDLNHG